LFEAFAQVRILKQFSRYMETLSLTINGESRIFDTPMSLMGLVEVLGYAGKRVAVERNGEIVPRSQHGEVRLEDGDNLEIVVAVGGG
jgi:sulfur carrier protein